jgi:hypothetical protein
MPPTAEHPITCSLPHVVYYDVPVAGAFVLIDGTVAATGPDVEHLTISDDPRNFDDVMIRYATAMMVGTDRKAGAQRP